MFLSFTTSAEPSVPIVLRAVERIHLQLVLAIFYLLSSPLCSTIIPDRYSEVDSLEAGIWSIRIQMIWADHRVIFIK